MNTPDTAAERWMATLSWGTLVTVWFVVVYGGADWLTAQRELRIPVHTSWELDLPLVPAWVIVYMSIYLVFLAAPLALTTVRKIRALARAECAVILVAGVCFLLLPSQLAYPPRPPELGVWTGLFDFAEWLNRNYNLAPSLHVTLTVICVSAYAYRHKVFWWSWAVLVAASTVLTHQHHLFDVVTGWALGLAGGWLYRRQLNIASAPGIEPTSPTRGVERSL